MDSKYDTLDTKCQKMVDEYDSLQDTLTRLRDIVTAQVNKMLSESGVEVTAVEARAKSRDSLIGKLIRKGHKYSSLCDITDLIGMRIVTLYSDDVDRVASYMQKTFCIDWDESIDKRKQHQMNSFGYNSLHYICSLPPSMCHDSSHPMLHKLRFEIQMRSTLQHVWAAMEHDIGYKSQIATPTEYRRMLSRLAGVLEMADEEFSRIRLSVADYRHKTEALIQAGALSEVELDGETFMRYIEQKPMAKLLGRIAAINQSEIQELPLEHFLPLVKEAGALTLQDLDDLIHNNEEDAYRFAMAQLAETDIDIIASTIALQDILIVDTLKKGKGKEGIVRLFDMLNGPSAHNEALANMACEHARNMPFMNRKKG